MVEKCSYLFYTIIGILIYINYVLLRLREESRNNPSIKINRNLYHDFWIENFQFQQQCCNALLCSLEGRWEIRTDTSFKELNRIEDSDMQLRMRKGWPTRLYHGDLRCGKKYPLPRLIRTNKEEFYYLDIVSQCDSTSNAPCCRDDVGWCGRGESFCQCKTCFDYGQLIHAELSTWKHNLNCSHSRLPSEKACDYLQSQFSSITFIGDSLVRHVFSSLLIHLTNDTKYGALKTDLHDLDKNFCSDENQFVDSSCHVKLATNWSDIISNPKYCKTMNKKIKLEFIQAFSSQHLDLALTTIENVLHEERPLIILGIGIHDNFDTSKVIDNYLTPIVELKSIHSMSTSPLFIWLNTHAAGPLKPMGFQETQGNKNIIHFNSVVEEYCRRNSILVFDTYNLTKGVHSFDGTHYGSTINQLKVDILINSLKTMNGMIVDKVTGV